MFIPREIYNELIQSSASFPVITITGPRQSGKTTLLKNVFPEKKYFSLEDPDTRQLALEDPLTYTLPSVSSTHYFNSYLETYIDRDLRQLIKVKALRQFELFVRLCAGRTGQIFV